MTASRRATRRTRVTEGGGGSSPPPRPRATRHAPRHSTIQRPKSATELVECSVHTRSEREQVRGRARRPQCESRSVVGDRSYRASACAIWQGRTALGHGRLRSELPEYGGLTADRGTALTSGERLARLAEQEPIRSRGAAHAIVGLQPSRAGHEQAGTATPNLKGTTVGDGSTIAGL